VLGPLASLARELGPLNAVLYGTSRLLSALSAGRVRLIKYYITAQPVRHEDLTPARRGRLIEVREGVPNGNLESFPNRPRAVIEARIRNGGRFLEARKEATLVGFQWFTLSNYPEDEVRCLYHLAATDRCAWDYDIVVFPEWRTQPVFTRLWDKCNEILRREGVTQTLSRIDAFNSSSRRAHERIGARTVGWALFLCFGEVQVATFSSRPWLHVSSKDSQAPVLPVSRMAKAAHPSKVENVA
jgi:hypothetical protein